MTITQLTAENVKRLKAVHIDSNGLPAVVVGGQNGQGKTSVLDAIAMALGGASKIPQEPVRRGTKNGKIVLETEEIIVERRFTSSGGTSLEVKGKDGAKLASPQAVLDKLCTSLAFDPLEFVRMGSTAQGRRRQAEKLVELAGINLSALEHRKDVLLAQRTEAKAKLSANEAYSLSPINLTTKRDEQAAMIKLDFAREAKTKFDRRMTANAVAKQKIAGLEEEIAQLKASIERKQAQIIETAKTIHGDDDPKIAPTLEAEVRTAEAELSEIRQHNSQVDMAVKEQRFHAQYLSAKELLATIESQLDSLAELRLQTIAEAKFPVDGIGLSEDGFPTFNGIPLDQCSSAENIRIGVAMAIAASPGMPVMLIRDGSLLDYGSLNLITEMADAAGAQVWIERVGSGSECTVVIEDGMVKTDPESPA